MTLGRVQVTDFRCLHSTDIEFDPRFTLLSGPNASGKTSILEAVYVLGRGRSFRTRRMDHLIRAGTTRFVVFGEVKLAERIVGLGVEGSVAGVRARVAGETVPSLGALAAMLPVQIIDPEVHGLVEEGPARRRRFMDWGVFHVEHTFIECWQKYQQALRQRNAALRGRQPRRVVSAWDSELLRLGCVIDAARTDYICQLLPGAAALVDALLGMTLSLTYRSGWARDTTFEEALESSWAQDLATGSTSVGPQRAELAILLDGHPAKDRISRGQQKLLAASLLLAQVRLLTSSSPIRPSLLLDDPAAELDGDGLLKLIHEVSQHAVQLIVTTLNETVAGLGPPGRRYRVRSGAVTEG